MRGDFSIEVGELGEQFGESLCVEEPAESLGGTFTHVGEADGSEHDPCERNKTFRLFLLRFGSNWEWRDDGMTHLRRGD